MRDNPPGEDEDDTDRAIIYIAGACTYPQTRNQATNTADNANNSGQDRQPPRDNQPPKPREQTKPELPSGGQQNWEEIYDSYVSPTVTAPGEHSWEEVYDTFYSHPYNLESEGGATAQTQGKLQREYIPPNQNYSHTLYHEGEGANIGHSLYQDYSSDYRSNPSTGCVHYRRRHSGRNRTSTIHRNAYRSHHHNPYGFRSGAVGEEPNLSRRHGQDAHIREGRNLTPGGGTPAPSMPTSTGTTTIRMALWVEPPERNHI